MRALRASIVLLVSILASGECISVSQKVAFQHAAVVFRGRVTRIQDLTGSRQAGIQQATIPPVVIDSAAPQLVTFLATTGWKGPVRDEMTVFVFRNPPQGSGYSFKHGSDYIVYGVGEAKSHWPALREKGGGGPIFDIGMCVLRVRTDIDKEAKLLGHGFSIGPSDH